MNHFLRNIFLFLIVISTHLVNAQPKTFLDKDYQLTEESEALYYVKNTIETSMDLVKVERYYVDNDQLESKGYMEQDGKKQGTWQWFYPNGKEKKQLTYSSGKVVGMQAYYSSDGTLIRAFKFDKNRRAEMPFEINHFTNLDGTIQVKDGNGFYKGPYYGFLETDIDSIAGNYKNGKATGSWKGYKNGSLLFEEHYEMGRLIKGKTFKNGSLNSNYNKFRQQAIPQMRYKKFRSLLHRNIMFYIEGFNINKADYRKELQLVLDIDIDGTVSNIRVFNGLGEGPDEAVIRGIKEVKSEWNPATIRGIPVPSSISLPWSFEYRDN